MIDISDDVTYNGSEIMWQYNYDVLIHYGIKGMRWGVRRSKEELAKQHKGQIAMTNALSSGKVSTKVKEKDQVKHLKGNAGYIEGRSYLFATSIEDAQKLINELSGTGSAICKKENGEWVFKERVTASRIIGKHVAPDTKIETKTRKAIIVYSQDGAHIFPRKDKT